jgi:predicted secreted protein
MKHISILLICLSACILVLLLSSCCVTKEVSIDESYDKQEIEVTTGVVLAVTLKATSCFDWRLMSISDLNVIEVVDNTFETPKLEEIGTEFSPFCGPEGKAIWTFQAIEKGRSTISMGLSAPYEGSYPVLKTFTLTVVVK